MRYSFTLTCLFLFVLLAIGAGCSKTSSSTPAANLEGLRTPPPASAPIQEPMVPPEAKNVPRPY